MWFKKGKDKFYFDSYGEQPHSELIAYLESPIFYNSERVQQNGEVFLRLFMSLRIDYYYYYYYYIHLLRAIVIRHV